MINNKYYVSISLVLISSVIFSFLLLSSSPSSADTSASASVTVASACTFSSTVDSNHSATIPAGTYKDNIGKTTFSIVCNDSEGYSVYAVGYSNSEFGNNKLIATINGALSPTNDINTGTNTSGSPSSWAMKLTPGTGLTTSNILNNYNNYNIVPNQYTKVVTLTPATNISTNNTSSFEATYAANIAGNQPAGTYQGKVRYAMVHPASEVPSQPHDATVGCISYWPNASSVVDSMGDQCKDQNGNDLTNNQADVTLWASNFKRQGYGFVGWSDKFDWVLNANDANGNGTGENAGYHIYGPNQNITTPSNMTEKGLSLYAVWVKSTGNIQSWTGCGAMNVGQVTALTDQRDSNTYAVAKLADGKCWMIENLRLDNTNSDNATGDLAQGYNTSTFKGLADPETPWANNPTTANSLYSTDGANNTFAITGSSQSYRFPRYNNTNTSNTVTNMTSPINANIYSYGNYYTWPAAIADTTNYTTNGQTISNTSICPKGWHIPYGNNATTEYGGNTAGGFYYLGDKLGATTDSSTSSKIWRSYPNNFIYSGGVYSSSVNFRGSLGYYWSSTVLHSTYAYNLYLDSSIFYPGTHYISKYRAFMARCIAGS